MRPSLIAAALIAAAVPAICVVIPPSQAEDSTAKLSRSNVDVIPAQLERRNSSSAMTGAQEAFTRIPPCPAGQTFQRSICFSYQIVRRFCITNPRNPAIEDTQTVHCQSDEVCVERNLSDGRSYAECHPLATLVRWKTDPVGQKRGCTDVSNKLGRYHNVGTIVYDSNSNPIQVGKIAFTGEPGDKDLGYGGSTSYASSQLWNFDAGHFVQVCIISAGAGNLNAFSWLW
ncbi:hypothetical protein C8034_v011409 [Colletotrichum sidae]|uniref:Secreted in xylem 6 n=1 Tax=Colletotrichum sidae TaxID=1347389 RepID=A0A4R8T0T2_9PEZI|nr:hypothetical protein C8034_v011409 [Colletotrichum sidae]